MASSLQQTPISLQSKTQTLRTNQILLSSHRPLNLSFSAAFPSLNLSTNHCLRRSGGSAAGAKMVSSASASYATALADVAVSNDTLESTNADVEEVEKIFSDPNVSKFFANPTIAIEKKFQVVEEISASSKLQPHTSNFLKILLDSKRIELVSEIVKEFEIVYNKLTETELAVVSSVVKLESQHLAQIAKQVQKLTRAKNVRIKTVIDPSLVAGFTVRYGNSGSKLIDMSVKKQLEEIAAQLDLGDIQLAQ